MNLLLDFIRRFIFLLCSFQGTSLPVVPDSFYIIPNGQAFVNTFFSKFSKYFFKSLIFPYFTGKTVKNSFRKSEFPF